MNARGKASVAAAAALLVALVGVGVVLINAWVGEEKQRDLLQWESRLGLVADARADAVGRLLAGDRRDLEELASNASLRFYLWQLTGARARPAEPGGTEPGSLGYLRNLLLAAAERHGYAAGEGARLPANVPQPRTAGLAVLDARLATVVATPGLFDVAEVFGSVARRALAQPGSRAAELMADADGVPVVVIAVAISAAPGTTTAGEAPAGVLLGVRAAADALYPLLARGPDFAEDSETLLLGKRPGAVVFLSPTRDGSPALRRVIAADRTDVAEVAAMAAPGRFFDLPNYRGIRVLEVSRPVSGQPWVLAQQVDAAQALSLADERRRFLVVALSLLLFAVVAVAVAAWRHGSSVRARHQAEELTDKAARLQRQTDLLHTITDSLDVFTLLVGPDNRVLFINQAAATAAGSSIQAILGNTLAGFLPAAVGQELANGIELVRRQGGTVHRLISWPLGEEQRTLRASFIPVDRIGVQRELVLLVLGDVTGLQQVHQRSTDLLRRLVLTLVSAVDRHDPYAANHARRMTEVADALARELGFSDHERHAVTLAASLANIGKIMVPVEVLTKPAPLTAAEQELLRRHVDHGLELLRGLQFDGAVADIIAQKQERPDGLGYPRGLGGERISLAGQVLAVANAFVALLSPRAYRQGLSVQGALDELMRGAGSQFDRRVLAALYHLAENRRDWSQWR